MKSDLSGLEALADKLDKLAENAQKLEGNHSFSEIFSKDFMKQHTQFSSIDEFLENGGFPTHSTEEFEAVPNKIIDEYVQKYSDFQSWSEMLHSATEQYIAKNLGL